MLDRPLHLLLCPLVVMLGCAAPGAETTTSAPSFESASFESSSLAANDRIALLATGAKLSGANGMHFGPDGLLYVASVLGSEIVVLDPDTGAVVRRISKGVDSPDDIAFSSDGSFYWTSILTGEVAGMRPDGSIVTAARLTPGSNPITFSPGDRLFVSQCFFDDKLYELDPKGIDEPRLLSDQLGPGCGLNGMDWGPNDRLYGPRWFRGEVVSFDVDSLEMRTEATGFEVPAAVKFDSKGRLHVLDTGAGTVVRVEGDEHRVIATLSPGLDNLAFDSIDRLFVSSFVDGFVVRVNPDGSQTPLSPGGLSHPGGLTLRDGRRGQEVVVADLQSIRGFDAASGESTFVERNILGMGEMGSASNISADGSHLILTSWLDGSVKVWDPVARKVLEAHHELAGPVSAVRYAGRIVVAEHGTGRVIAFGKPDTGDAKDVEVIASGLAAPTGLAVRRGDLFVGDHASGEILRIATGGSSLDHPEVVAKNLGAPEGIAATPSGFLVVDGASGALLDVDANGEVKRIAKLDVGAGAASPAQPPSMIFNGIAVSSGGGGGGGGERTAWVTGETTRAVYRISLD